MAGRLSSGQLAWAGRAGGREGAGLVPGPSLFSIPTQPSLCCTEDVRPGNLHRASWVLVLTERLRLDPSCTCTETFKPKEGKRCFVLGASMRQSTSLHVELVEQKASLTG